MQREQQNRLMDEMFSPISNQVLPASIEERLEIYQRRIELEEQNIDYKIIKHKFLNYRQFNCKLIAGKKEDIDAYALSFSTLPRKKAQGRIEFLDKNIYYFNREEIKIITLDYFNSLCETQYKTVKELIYNPPSLQIEQTIRNQISDANYDLTPIIVLEKIIDTKITIFLDAKTYEDTKEKIILL